MNKIAMEDKEFRVKVGLRIRKYRRMRDMSQDALAVLTGLSAKTISRIENGQAPIGMERIRRIAAALEITAEDLIK